MITVATLLLATNLIGPVINSTAVATIESGGNTRAVGKLGERGLFQFRKAAWRTAAPRWNYDLAFSAPHARQAFTSYSLHLASQFYTHTSRWPSAQEFYVMYNLGPTRFRHTYKYDINRVPSAVRRRAHLYESVIIKDYANRGRSNLVKTQRALSLLPSATIR